MSAAPLRAQGEAAGQMDLPPGLDLPPEQELPAAESFPVEGGTAEILPDTVSPDGAFCLAIRTDAKTKGLSLLLIQVADKRVFWHSNPTGGLDDPFRFRLRPKGFRDMQYAWAPDGQTLALATATSRGSWVFILKREDAVFASSKLQEATSAELFPEHKIAQSPGDPPEGVRKLYMNLEFAGRSTLEVTTEGFFFAGTGTPKQFYYEAVVRYALDPAAKQRIPKQDVKVTPIEELERQESASSEAPG